MSNPLPAIPAKESPWMQAPAGQAAGTAASTAADAPAEQVEEATPAQIDSAVREINTSLQSRSISLRFEVDEDTDKLIVKVVDTANGEVIRQIPNEEVVRIAKVMGKAPGLLMSEQA